jgi:methionyl aminopeptidase
VENVSRSARKAVELKSAAEIAIMRQAGRMLDGVMREVVEAVVPGITTDELDRLARARIREAGGKPAFLGLYGFPRTLCISINREVVHGIPGKRQLLEGDIVSIDCGVRYKGYFSDRAYTVGVGRIAPEATRLLDVTREALVRAISQCRPGNRLGDIGHAVQSWVEANGFSIVREYGGHGIGRDLHEEPRVENFGAAGSGPRLQAGMVLAVEPMVAAGGGETEVLEDDWTVVTSDGSLAAHFEHTVAVTDSGPEVLTRAGDGQDWG